MLKTTNKQRYNAYLDAIDRVLRFYPCYICNTVANSIGMDIRCNGIIFKNAEDKGKAILEQFPEFAVFQPNTHLAIVSGNWFQEYSQADKNSTRLIILAFCLTFLNTNYE